MKVEHVRKAIIDESNFPDGEYFNLYNDLDDFTQITKGFSHPRKSVDHAVKKL
jgi:hypothetical protein